MSKRFIKDFVFEKHGKSKDLIILFHAYTSSPEKLNSVKEVCKSIDRYKNSDILIPRIPASLFSIADPVEITREILNKVDEVWDGNGQYSSIILIGHSLGALLARKLYVYACGKNQGVPFEIAYNKPKLWAGKVERIILLAGMNRGWSISYHMSLLNAVGYTIGSFIGDLIVFTSPFVPLIFRIKKGSSFITNLRIQWLAMRKEDNIKVKGAGNALTIQLLGSIDDIVSPEDNLDLVTGSDFFYIDAPNSGHANIIEMDSTKEGESRKKAFTEALLMDAKKVKNIHPSDQQFPEPNKEITDVIFVMHGIRDLGYWTNKIARKVKKLSLNDEKKVFATKTSSYGYFPMLSFLLPAKRREKVEWFMDQYTESKAMYPNADFSFVGHSNGTYLLAKALTEYPCCKFKNVIFAGSVVPTTYTWNELIKKGQVKSVMNYVATSDWVVALFPKVIEILKIQDLGSAGHDGFNDLVRPNEIEYVRGSHGAALKEEHWDDIAEFIVNEKVPDKTFQMERSSWIVWLGHISPLVWLAIISLVIFIGSLIVNQSEWAEWFKTTVFIGYMWFLYKILTRF